MSNREELPDSLFSTDEFLNSDRGDVFVGYGSLPDKSPTIDDFFQLPRADFDTENDIIQESIEIPQPGTNRIILDGSDSGSDSGISGEHPKSAFVGYDGKIRNGVTVIQRSNATSPPFLTPYPTYVISKQPTSLGQPRVHRSNVNIVQDMDLNRHGSILLTRPQDVPLAVSDQLVEVDSPIAIDHRHVNSNDDSPPVTGLVLTANDLLVDSGSIDLPDDDYCVKEEPYNPKMHSILQSKVKIQPRPNMEAIIPNNIAGTSDSNYSPMAKRVRSSSNIKTVVPTMVTGEDTAEIVYTPQTTYVLNSTRDTITLPPSLQVKTEPYLTPSCSIEQPTIVNTTSSAAALKSSQMSDHIFVSMYENADGTKQFKFHNDLLGQESYSSNDIVERGRLAKKQERMIKNRQAASLSRQRKKEYLETLEGTLDALKRENRELRKSNNDIRRRYDELTRKMELLEKQAQNATFSGQSSCSSPPFDSVASFLSPSDSPLTMQTVINNSNIVVSSHSLPTISAIPCRTVNGLSSVNSHASIHHNIGSIQYSPQLRRKVPTVTTALAASSALAFFCLLVVNLNTNISLFDTTPHSSSQWRSKKYNTQNPSFSSAHSDALSRLNPILGAFDVRQPMIKAASRNLLSVPYSMESVEKDHPTQRSNHLPQCPVVSFNSTESIRVASELNQFATQYKKEAKLAFLRDFWYRKTSKNMHSMRNRHRESNTRRMHMKRHGSRSNAIQVHKSAGDPRMDQLMFGFRRRNDTIYFVSLTGDHYIFPAINTSKSRLSRPKVSFIMPAVFGLNDTVRPGRDQIAMMQIDSEVLNYTVFHLDKRHLSTYFKANPFWRPSKSWGGNGPPDQQ